MYYSRKKCGIFNKFISGFVAFTFLFTLVLPQGVTYAQINPTVLNLPVPGSMVSMSPGFTPTIIKGITIHPDDPLKFSFVIDTGDENLQGNAFKEESKKLIKYFLTALTVPEKEVWVNLSPYEKDRIVPDGLGSTEMGRDMLAQDYILKQFTASMIYPEKDLGKKFWDRVYKIAQEKYGTTEVPINTFNKVWIVPEEAVVYEHESTAYIMKSRLGVMLEEDFLALEKNLESEQFGIDKNNRTNTEVISGVSSEVVREVLIPELEREVNEGQNFAKLRQIYHSMILATWYKLNLKQSLLGQVYVDQNKTLGIDTQDKGINEKIYNQYIEAFTKGVYDYIKEDYDPDADEIIPKKYFSGGVSGTFNRRMGKWLTELVKILTAPSDSMFFTESVRTIKAFPQKFRLVEGMTIPVNSGNIQMVVAADKRMKRRLAQVISTAMEQAASPMTTMSPADEPNPYFWFEEDFSSNQNVNLHIDPQVTKEELYIHPSILGESNFRNQLIELVKKVVETEYLDFYFTLTQDGDVEITSSASNQWEKFEKEIADLQTELYSTEATGQINAIDNMLVITLPPASSPMKKKNELVLVKKKSSKVVSKKLDKPNLKSLIIEYYLLKQKLKDSFSIITRKEYQRTFKKFEKVVSQLKPLLASGRSILVPVKDAQIDIYTRVDKTLVGEWKEINNAVGRPFEKKHKEVIKRSSLKIAQLRTSGKEAVALARRLENFTEPYSYRAVIPEDVFDDRFKRLLNEGLEVLSHIEKRGHRGYHHINQKTGNHRIFLKPIDDLALFEATYFNVATSVLAGMGWLPMPHHIIIIPTAVEMVIMGQGYNMDEIAKIYPDRYPFYESGRKLFKKGNIPQDIFGLGEAVMEVARQQSDSTITLKQLFEQNPRFIERLIGLFVAGMALEYAEQNDESALRFVYDYAKVLFGPGKKIPKMPSLLSWSSSALVKAEDGELSLTSQELTNAAPDAKQDPDEASSSSSLEQQVISTIANALEVTEEEVDHDTPLEPGNDHMVDIAERLSILFDKDGTAIQYDLVDMYRAGDVIEYVLNELATSLPISLEQAKERFIETENALPEESGYNHQEKIKMVERISGFQGMGDVVESIGLVIQNIQTNYARVYDSGMPQGAAADRIRELKELLKEVEEGSSMSSSPVATGFSLDEKIDSQQSLGDVMPGGINLDPALLDLQIKRDGKGIPLPINQQPIYDMHIEGFLPVIINVAPVSVPLLLGFDQTEQQPFETAQEDTDMHQLSYLDPFDLKTRFEFKDFEVEERKKGNS